MKPVGSWLLGHEVYHALEIRALERTSVVVDRCDGRQVTPHRRSSVVQKLQQRVWIVVGRLELGQASHTPWIQQAVENPRLARREAFETAE